MIHFVTSIEPRVRHLLHRLLRQSYTRSGFSPPVHTVSLNDSKPIAHIDERYLSYSIDISVLAGGFWWEGSTRMRRGLGTLRVPPLSLHLDKLNTLVNALGPAYLRVGGSEADKIHYFEAPETEPESLVLTREIWDNLHCFIQRHQLKFAFTVKYGLFKRNQHGSWCGDELEKLLRYSQQHNYRLDVCELGNELNAYWAFHGLASQPRASDLATDYGRFSQLVKQYAPQVKILGPGSAFWPKLGETLRPFSNITQSFLQHCAQRHIPIDIVDWHYYPFQSERAPVRTRRATTSRMCDPDALNDFARYSQQLRSWRDAYFPNAVLWTGETGSAQCGGQPKLSDRFISCFWWADQLGMGAKAGQQVMIRQSLIGGDYGLIDRLTLKPRPDYWLSWLWKQLMGTEVFDVSSESRTLRAYCHSMPAGIGGKTLLLINLSPGPVTVRPIGLGQLQKQFTLTAKKLKSRKLRINGIKARFKKGNFCLEDFSVSSITREIPGNSVSFWLFNEHPC